jgi:hypothetical protein
MRMVVAHARTRNHASANAAATHDVNGKGVPKKHSQTAISTERAKTEKQKRGFADLAELARLLVQAPPPQAPHGRESSVACASDPTRVRYVRSRGARLSIPGSRKPQDEREEVRR